MLVFLRGYEVDFWTCLDRMDRDIRDALTWEIKPKTEEEIETGNTVTEQEFLDEYCNRHEEKYGVEFEI